MTAFSYDIGIFGGDLRLFYMADLLRSAGCSVFTYSLSSAGLRECDRAASFPELIHQSRILSGPIPFSKNGRDINNPENSSDLTIEILARELTPPQILFGGCLPTNLKKTLEDKQITTYDFMNDEVLTIQNSIATAEGAIALAISKSTENLHHSHCLVTGYGVCAKTLAGFLNGLTAKVTVAARNPSARAAADAAGFDTADFDQLPTLAEQYDYIFNTVPAPVINQDFLEHVKNNVVIIDIASAPGGIDFAFAKSSNLNAGLYPGLPGIYAPKASAKFLIDCLLRKHAVEAHYGSTLMRA